MNSVKIQFKNVYGNRLIYIISDNAKTLSELMGKKTLTDKDIVNLSKLGFTISGYGEEETNFINSILKFN